MRILSIPTTYGLSRPISGGQNRFFNLTKALRRQGHYMVVLEENQLVSLADSDIARVYAYRDLRFRNSSLTVLRDLNPLFILSVMKIVRKERIDLIQITHPSGMLSVRLVLFMLRRRIPIVYDAHNLESEFVRESLAIEEKHSSMVKWIVVACVDVLERFACKHFADFVTTASSRDQRIMLAKYQLPADKVEVISSGCDISAYADDRMRTAARNRLGIPMDATVVVFHGSYLHSPNREAFDLIISHLAPRFREINDKVRFVIGGTGSPQFTKDNVISLGSIDNLREFLSLADIAIAPLRHGAGIKLKVLDYLSAGLPMVVTVKGTQGVDVTDGYDSIIVDDCDEHFVQAIRRLVENAEERSKIGTNARKLADERYDWIKIGNRLNELFQRIVG